MHTIDQEPKGMEWIEELEDNDIIYCPKCNEEVEEASNAEWEYLDGERKEFTCPCGNKIAVVIDRPILYQLFSTHQ